MDPKLYRLSKCYSTNKITFFLYNLSGQIVGYQHYRPLRIDKKGRNNPYLGRYFTKLPKSVIGVFGLELLNPKDKRVFVVEGIFKAGVLHRLGYNAIAVLGSSPDPLQGWFKAMRGQWDLIAIGDADKAGNQFVRIVGKGFQSPIDLDEMTDEDIRKLIEENED
jgi:DNA primase